VDSHCRTHCPHICIYQFHVGCHIIRALCTAEADEVAKANFYDGSAQCIRPLSVCSCHTLLALHGLPCNPSLGPMDMH